MTRTHIYAKIFYPLGHLKEVQQETKWIEASEMLSVTEVWEEWKNQVLLYCSRMTKKLYKEIDIEKRETKISLLQQTTVLVWGHSVEIDVEGRRYKRSRSIEIGDFCGQG
jgi:hypothetical protein